VFKPLLAAVSAVLAAAAIAALAGAAVLACEDARAPTAARAPERPSAELAVGAGGAGDQGVITEGTIPLPINQSVASTGVAFGVTQTGSGPSGAFKINSSSNANDALFAQTTGTGNAIEAQILNLNNSQPAISVKTNGSGDAVRAVAFATRNARAGFFQATNNTEAINVANTGSGFAARFRGSNSISKGVLIETSPGQVGLQVVGGTKNAVVGTSSGARALYAEEATEVFFTDYGFARLKNGRAWIPLDMTFTETVNAGEPYHVFLEEYGDADLRVARRTFSGFEVVLRNGDAAAEFSYRIVAKRRGFEGARLERAPWADSVAR
jgi:hypothetical protein